MKEHHDEAGAAYIETPRNVQEDTTVAIRFVLPVEPTTWRSPAAAALLVEWFDKRLVGRGDDTVVGERREFMLDEPRARLAQGAASGVDLMRNRDGQSRRHRGARARRMGRT